MIALGLAIAGGLGAVARYLVDVALRRLVPNYPLGTLVINVAGSFVLGVLVGLHQQSAVPAEALVVLGAGFCGGFTTFSTASVDVAQMICERRRRTAAIHLTLMFATCTLAAALGVLLTR